MSNYKKDYEIASVGNRGSKNKWFAENKDFYFDVESSEPNYFTDVVEPIGDIIAHLRMDEGFIESGSELQAVGGDVVTDEFNFVAQKEFNPFTGSLINGSEGGYLFDVTSSNEFFIDKDGIYIDTFGNSSWSISLWANFYASDDYLSKSLLGARRASSTDSFYLYHYNIGRLTFTTYFNGSFNALMADAGCTSTNDNSWKHIVIVCDRDLSQKHLYIDGEKFSSAFPANTLDWDSANLSIGGVINGSFPTFGGGIDEITFFKKALTDDDVADLGVELTGGSGGGRFPYCGSIPYKNTSEYIKKVRPKEESTIIERFHSPGESGSFNDPYGGGSADLATAQFTPFENINYRNLKVKEQLRQDETSSVASIPSGDNYSWLTRNLGD